MLLIPIKDIIIPKGRRKKKLSQVSLELIKSIVEMGYTNQPIIVRQEGKGRKYHLIDGYHRILAAKELGITEVAARCI